jgi:enoyl-CoA hydratase/carnithine racemase
MLPSELQRDIEYHNRNLFDYFLDFPKPLVVAVNGPAIGASVTSSTLCDAVVAAEGATFSTPFARLGVPPEGCSSVHFERILGAEAAERMLGPEGWVPTAREALAIGLVDHVVLQEDLLATAQQLAEKKVADGGGPTIKGSDKDPDRGLLPTMKAVNAAESKALATAFLSVEFFQAQIDLATKKKKPGVAMLFQCLKATRPLWAMSL